MAGGEERILRRRIKSVNSTKKITRAMELIAATRIVKAQQRVAAARPYADQITSVIQSLASSGAGAGEPLLTPKPDAKKIAYIVVAGDRGLAGAYNSAIIRMAERSMVADVGPLGTTPTYLALEPSRARSKRAVSQPVPVANSTISTCSAPSARMPQNAIAPDAESVATLTARTTGPTARDSSSPAAVHLAGSITAARRATDGNASHTPQCSRRKIRSPSRLRCDVRNAASIR